MTGRSIQHEIMYKQYLASLHKLGKREVISATHYAACVRTIFGGSVGPNKKQMENGKVEQFFDGVAVRATPLPLRIPASAAKAASPILTNLLHRKSPDLTQKTNEENGINIKKTKLKFEEEESANNNGMLAHLLEKKEINPVVNGLTKIDEENGKKTAAVVNNHTDFKNLNGQNLKRPASEEIEGGPTPPKNALTSDQVNLITRKIPTYLGFVDFLFLFYHHFFISTQLSYEKLT